MLDGDVTDAVEAQSVGLNPQHVHIYSAGWGPNDDGRTVDGPGSLTRLAIATGVQNGRSGLGSIYVWASGIGGRDGDSCNCDGYTNSIQTLSISSATDSGHIPWYLEQCSSTMATTYSTGTSMDRQLVTTDLHHTCTLSHSGTAASAAIASGIVALSLEANPHLGWRDVQHLVVRTARRANLKAQDWVTNGVGRNVSHAFGYGLMDAAARVTVARQWISVGHQHRCAVVHPQRNIRISTRDRSSLISTLNTDGCQDTAQHVKYLEHVQAELTVSAARRGEIEIYLTSPQGTRSVLLETRPRDNDTRGFDQWPFMTVFNWGEISYGNWTLEIKNAGLGTLSDFTFIMYGTEEEPPYDVMKRSSGDKLRASPISATKTTSGIGCNKNSEGHSVATTASVKKNSVPGIINSYKGDYNQRNSATASPPSQTSTPRQTNPPASTHSPKTATIQTSTRKLEPACSEPKPVEVNCNSSHLVRSDSDLLQAEGTTIIFRSDGTFYCARVLYELHLMAMELLSIVATRATEGQFETVDIICHKGSAGINSLDPERSRAKRLIFRTDLSTGCYSKFTRFLEYIHGNMVDNSMPIISADEAFSLDGWLRTERECARTSVVTANCIGGIFAFSWTNISTVSASGIAIRSDETFGCRQKLVTVHDHVLSQTGTTVQRPSVPVPDGVVAVCRRGRVFVSEDSPRRSTKTLLEYYRMPTKSCQEAFQRLVEFLLTQNIV